MSYTIDYYNKNADEFFEGTVNADMAALHEHFEKYLKEGDRVLDCGCGSGRDTKHFMEKGYKVDAIDGSEEMCLKAEAFTGIKVKCMKFEEIDLHNMYDGIWACASLLHEDEKNLEDVIGKLINGLKPEGVLYMSFKYGDFCGERNGRYFVNMTEEKIEKIVKKKENIIAVESWITGDVREGRADEKWINVIVKKK